MSVIDSFRPITRACGLIEGHIEAVSAATIRVLEDRDRKLLPLTGLGALQGPTTHETEKIDNDLRNALSVFDPLSVNIVTRHLLLQTKSEWIAYFNNSNLADGDRQLIGALNAEMHTKTIYVKRQENTAHRFGAFVFHFHSDGKRVRVIENTVQDRGWEFEQGGTPFPFEVVDQYSVRKKADRFNEEMLIRYLGELGLRPFDDDFYLVNSQHLAYLIKRIDRDERLRSRIQTLSLFDARAKEAAME